MKISRWIATALACLASCLPSHGAPTSTELVEMLVSENRDVVAKGEALLAADEGQLMEQILQRIDSGDPVVSGKAAAELGILISPWVRGKEARARFIRWTPIPSPRRPVERATGHPQAAAMRDALRSGLVKLLEAKLEKANFLHVLEATKAICETLGEVADDDTIDWTLARLDLKPPARLAEPLAGLVSGYLGIPPVFRQLGICGNSTAEEVAKFHALQDRELSRTCSSLRASWKKVRSMPTEERVRFAIDAWWDRFEPQSGRFHHEGWLFEIAEPLVRFGAPAVGPLRAAQQEETRLEAKGTREVIIAAITGKPDPVLMKALFQGRDPDLEVACEIIAASGSTDWLPELDELQQKPVSPGFKAARAIAICQGTDGIPMLKHAAKQNESLILKLEGRKAGKLRPGLRRYSLP